ncbi:hypothetical protein D3C87_905760 [compost metagenome]
MDDDTVSVRWERDGGEYIEFFYNRGINVVVHRNDPRFAVLKAILDLLPIDEGYCINPAKDRFIRWYNDLPKDMFDTALALEQTK